MVASNSHASSAQFTLSPAIFVPFAGVPKDEVIPTDREEKLLRILENLDKQHVAVKKNMVFMIERQKEIILQEAEEASKTEEAKERYAKDEPRIQREVDDVIARLRTQLKKPALPPKKASLDANVEMTGTSVDALISTPTTSTSTPASDGRRGSTSLQEGGTSSLRALVEKGVRNLKGYNEHMERTKDFYRKALERQRPKRDSEVTAQPAEERRGSGGMLPYRDGDIRVDREALARMDLSSSHAQQPVQSSVDFARDPRLMH